MWFKWHLLNLGLKIKSILGGLKRTAVDEVNNISKKDEPKIRGGDALHYENDIASRYYDFWNSDFSNMGRMNLYFLVIIIAVITTVVRFAMGGMNQQVVSEDYLLLSAAGIGGLLLILFVFELFRKKSDDIPITENEYNKARTWMHYISEKARSPMPWWAGGLVGLGLLMEAAAISMIAISYAGDFSKDIAQYAGTFTGLIVAGALGYLIHSAGESLYREHHRKRLQRVIRNEGDKDKNEQGEWVSKTYRHLKGSNVDSPSGDPDSLEGENVFDINEQGFWRRNGTMLGAILLIVLIAGLAFEQRAALNKIIIQGQTGAETSGTLMPGLIPSNVSDAQKSSQSAIVSEKISDAEIGMYSALGVLTLVFLLINIVGLIFGYKYCFYNDQSEKNYEKIKKYMKQQSLRVKDIEYSTLARKKLLAKSNQFFAKFQRHAVKQARREGLDSIQEGLNERGSYRMEHFANKQRAAA